MPFLLTLCRKIPFRTGSLVTFMSDACRPRDSHPDSRRNEGGACGSRIQSWLTECSPGTGSVLGAFPAPFLSCTHKDRLPQTVWPPVSSLPPFQVLSGSGKDEGL